jgi:ribosomal-protein-serine acetyltransferase
MKAPINDGSVGIRKFRIEDASDLYSAVCESADQLCHWMTWCHRDYTLEDSKAFISSRDRQWAAGNEYSFVIYSLRDGAFLGSVGLNRRDRVHHFANLGYWVRSVRLRQGIGSAAVRLAARFAFEQTDLSRLEIIVPVQNRFSVRVAEKAGAHLEGVLKRRVMLQGRPQDAFSYSLIAPALGV